MWRRTSRALPGFLLPSTRTLNVGLTFVGICETSQSRMQPDVRAEYQNMRVCILGLSIRQYGKFEVVYTSKYVCLSLRGSGHLRQCLYAPASSPAIQNVDLNKPRLSTGPLVGVNGLLASFFGRRCFFCDTRDRVFRFFVARPGAT